jgi:hypothetical protein
LSHPKLSLVGIESGRNTTCFEAAEQPPTKAEYIRLIGDLEEAARLLRAAAYFETGHILTRRGMVFEGIAHSFKIDGRLDFDLQKLALME